MDDLISRQAAIEALEEPCKVSDTLTDEYAVGERMQWEKDVKALNSLPSAEWHGRWINHGSFEVCSVCGEEQYGHDSGRYYCPNCGSRMDLGGDEE